MATILLSIKPEYANKIFDGQKRYEYRKRIPKKEVSKIIVYSSAPEQALDSVNDSSRLFLTMLLNVMWRRYMLHYI